MSNAKRKKIPISGITVCFFFLAPIIWHLSPLEFINPEIERFFYYFFLFGGIVAVLLSVVLIIKAIEGLDAVLGVMVIIGYLGFLLFIIILMAVSWGMCSYTTGEVLYKKGNGDEIVIREFGCGATDSGAPTKSVAKISSFTPWFISIQRIDTTSLDKTKWKRVIRQKDN